MLFNFRLPIRESPTAPSREREGGRGEEEGEGRGGGKEDVGGGGEDGRAERPGRRGSLE